MIKRKILKKLYATRLLRLAKRSTRYRDLESMLGIDATLLARYVTGTVMPGTSQARRIIEGLGGARMLADILRRSIEEHGGYIDLAPLLSDVDYLCALALDLSIRYERESIDTVLVPETSGISLATLIASNLDARLVIARRRKENPLHSYYEEHLVRPPNIRRSFYVRQGLLVEGSNVLIVDDIIHSGLTLELMLRIARKANTRVAGIASVVAVGDRWREILEGVRVEYFLYYPG
ncbi:MAG: hypothetical protein F7C34_05405 [Desulfurococcales archaeon]|nr:hypothetical protein [Desulfurococcales archaeon]